MFGRLWAAAPVKVCRDQYKTFGFILQAAVDSATAMRSLGKVFTAHAQRPRPGTAPMAARIHRRVRRKYAKPALPCGERAGLCGLFAALLRRRTVVRIAAPACRLPQVSCFSFGISEYKNTPNPEGFGVLVREAGLEPARA